MNIQQEIVNQFRQQQEKYIYYLVALSVAAIAFSVHNTLGEPIKWSQLPLGLSVVLWGISIYCGLTSLQYFIGSLVPNIDLINAKRAQSPIAEKIQEGLNDVSKKTKGLVKTQRYTFYSGMVCYVLWHLTEMIILAYC